MVVAIISEWFSENMGYVENHLPTSFNKLGCEVHVVTSNLQIYATNPELYKSVYEPFLGPAVVKTGSKELNGFTLHRLLYYTTKFGIGLEGLSKKLAEIKPDIVYLFEINTEHTLQVIKYKSTLGYKIFTESRLHLSVYNPPKKIKDKISHYFNEKLKWMQAGRSFEKCYPVAPDVLKVITKYFGQSKRKCILSSLAVDTDNFKPITTDVENKKRIEFRNKLNYSEDDIICIYTGRFTNDKGTIILAKAIDFLHKEGEINFKGLFVGAGDPEYEVEITEHAGCQIHPFVQSAQLVQFYQAADIGVWPKQESTSQLDAVACGLPIIISSKVQDINRIKDNGLSYKNEDFIDLAKQIKSLLNQNIRKSLGETGVKKIKQSYSWDHIAKSRLDDFNKSMLMKKL